MNEFWKKCRTEIPVPDASGLRRFGLVTAGIMAGLCGLVFPWLLTRPLPLWPWIVAGPLSALALLAPASLRWIYYGWMTVAVMVGWINTRVIIGLVFFLVVLPMGLVMRVIRRDPLALKFDPMLSSYRVSRANAVPSMDKPF